MPESMNELNPRRTVEQLPANSLSAAADIAVSNEFKRLNNKRQRVIKKLVVHAALTSSAFSFIIASACGNSEEASFPPNPEPTPISTPFVPTETLAASEYTYLQASNTRVALDKEGLPVYYVLPDGRKVNFDRGEIKKIRERALVSKESEIITMIPVEENNQNSFKSEGKPSLEHPKTLELPKDVLSEEELERRGIKIIQADNTNLYIRKGAFEEGSLLNDYNGDSDKKLTIVLVNGPYVSDFYMKDTKYDTVRNSAPKDKLHLSQEELEEYKPKTIQTLENILDDYREEVKKIKSPLNEDNKHRSNLYEYQIEEIKKIIFVFKEKVLTDEQLSTLYAFERSRELAGRHSRVFKGREPDRIRDSIIFVAVGEYGITKTILTFDKDGHAALSTGSLFSTENHPQPSAWQTHPDPKWFKLNPEASSDNPDSYPYGGQMPGFTLRHEGGHDEGLSKTEYKTDLRAMETIRRAWDRWEKSGFTDNSGYYFVFSLPPEVGGGYILTKIPKSNSGTPNSS